MESMMVSKTTEIVEFLTREMNAAREDLAYLDSLTGDGDMGVTVTLIFRAMKKTAPKLEGKTSSEIFSELGEQVGETAPSTFGTLFATMLKSFGKAVGDISELDATGFAKGLAAAADGVMERGKAKPGDKTLLDALCPAAAAAAVTAATGAGLQQAAKAAAEAAHQGAESTVSMKAVTGRAGYMGERTVGNKDSGAEAIARMFDAFSKYLCEEK